MGLLRYLGLVISTAWRTSTDWTQLVLFLLFVAVGFVRKFMAPDDRAAILAGKVGDVLVTAETAAILFGSVVAARLVAAPYLIWRDDQKRIAALHRPTPHETTTSVAGSPTSVLLLPSNPRRKGATIYNNSVSPLFVKFGSDASPVDYKLKMAPDGYFEFPVPAYPGPIYGVWLHAGGAAQLTETI